MSLRRKTLSRSPRVTIIYHCTASGLASPPSTPTQSSSPPVFSLDAPCSAAERLEERRARSLSSPPDTGQRFSLACSYSKPPIFTSSSSSSAFSPGPAMLSPASSTFSSASHLVSAYNPSL
ncbi:hypothetical protein MHYP_G00281550 [Metynnis hypsauchen]